MLQIEQRLRQGFPHWFRSQRVRTMQSLLRTLGRQLRFDPTEAFPASDGHSRDFYGLIEVELHRMRAKKRKRHPQRALAA